MWVVKFAQSPSGRLLQGALGVVLLITGAVAGSLAGLMMLMTGVVLMVTGIVDVLDSAGGHRHQS